MKILKNAISGLFIILLTPNLVFSQLGNVNQDAARKPSIAFIGTYHMGSQGNNVYKGEHDDVLSAARQAELKVLINKLKEFNPTKIMVERDVIDSSKVMNRYKRYLEGDFELSRNEVHQIGFRLAKELNHKKIYSIDWGIFPKDQLYWYENFAKTDSTLNSFLTKIREEGSEYYEQRNKKLNALSILDQIKLLNKEENIENDHKAYFDIMRIGLGDKYVGANYLSWWYGRNMKILVNIIRQTESPNDRILVIYGNGHMKLLNQLTNESDFYNVIDASTVLGD